MLSFQKLTLEDIGLVRNYYTQLTCKSSLFTVGGTLMWRDYCEMEYAIFNETLIIKMKSMYNTEITAFRFPLGKDLDGSIREIKGYCWETGIPVAFCMIAEGGLRTLTPYLEGCRYFYERSESDYLYNASDMITLPGRKYHGQRNHINFFKKTYGNYSFEEITEANIDEVKGFYDNFNKTVKKDSDIFIEEQRMSIEVLNNYSLYGLIGGLLRVDGEVAAFSIGEKCGDELHIHIEKADVSRRGAYQVINNEFAKHYATNDIAYINREEDVGDEGLRTAKLAYHPCEIVNKYIVMAD